MTGPAPSEADAPALNVGWILRFGPEVACRRSQLEHRRTPIPEAEAFVAAVPQAGRIICPLWHMLAIELPPALRLPKWSRRQRRGKRTRERLLPDTTGRRTARSRLVRSRLCIGGQPVITCAQT